MSTFFLPTMFTTMFACWHTSQVKTHNQKEWSVPNQIEFTGLRQNSYLLFIWRLFITPSSSFKAKIEYRLCVFLAWFRIHSMGLVDRRQMQSKRESQNKQFLHIVEFETMTGLALIFEGRCQNVKIRWEKDTCICATFLKRRCFT